MVDALDPEGTEIGVLNSLCRLRGRDELALRARKVDPRVPYLAALLD
jgi:hypothetical protein